MIAAGSVSGRSAEQLGVGKEVGDDPVLAGVGGEPGALPFLPGTGEVVEEIAVMDLEEVLVGMGIGGDEPRPGVDQRGADPLGSLGNFGPGSTNADPDLAARLMQAVLVAPDDG